MKKKVLVCAGPDLNFVDGSSIWAQTICLATAATGDAHVDFIAKSKPEREHLFRPLMDDKNVSVVDGTNPEFWAGKTTRRLTMPMMAELAVQLDHRNTYDVIIVRGLEIAQDLLDTPETYSKCWVYLTDIPQNIEDYSPELRLIMKRIARGCQMLLCQTDGFKSLWKSLVPDLPESKISIYTPVIPNIPANLTPVHSRPRRAIYAGKFKGDWMTLDMAELWPEVRDALPDSELIMIGDKIHAEPTQPDYQTRMREALDNTAGLNWLGPQSRDVVQEELRQARVGLSWRAESMNDTVEYSTKILEYGGAGCAAILNRNALHENLLGKDYPLFANSAHEFSTQLKLALSDSNVASEAARRLQQLAETHTFSSRVDEIRRWLGSRKMPAKTKQVTRVLVAGHDLKFFTLLRENLERTGAFEFIFDQWKGHDRHDESESRRLLGQADAIFCEWCLGNLKWYSNNKMPHQKLVARFHGQERTRPYLSESNWANIDHIGYVSDLIRREGQKASGFPTPKISVIPNLLDDAKFTPRKKMGDARFVLGIIGVAPSSKRLDRALDLLELLLQEDPRYCLRVKGKNPLDYDWLIKRSDEREFYENVFRRINSNPLLRHRVIFDPQGDDINLWFSLVGFILSPSDFESFHMAVGEGMLTGATPIIWDRDGAGEIWPREFVVRNTHQAKDHVLAGMTENVFSHPEITQYLANEVANRWKKVLLS